MPDEKKDQPDSANLSGEPSEEEILREAAREAAKDLAEEVGAPSSEAQIAELNDKLLRALAETENLRRRARKEREDASRYAIAGFARDMVTVADNLHRALAAAPAEARAADPAIDTVLTGVELTEKELLAALERHGIQRIEPLGEKFNHDLHEAMFEVPTDDQPPGTVVQVMEPGYVIHDRLLRAARVGVAKPAGTAPSGRVDTTA